MTAGTVRTDQPTTRSFTFCQDDCDAVSILVAILDTVGEDDLEAWIKCQLVQ